MSAIDTKASPLAFRDFFCTPDHAVECAYLLSLAEAEYARDPACNAAEVIELYARGDVSMSEAIDALQPDIDTKITQAEFVDRFVDRMVSMGPETFADGTSVREYAKEAALTYWADERQRADGPEECADNDLYYGAQDHG